MRLEFDDEYDIEESQTMSHSMRCRSDYLLFQDGPFAFSPNITIICGVSRGQPIRSTSRQMRIVFRTDTTYERTGFNMTIHYELIDGNMKADI